jgi:hypothetical protein
MHTVARMRAGDTFTWSGGDGVSLIVGFAWAPVSHTQDSVSCVSNYAPQKFVGWGRVRSRLYTRPQNVASSELDVLGTRRPVKARAPSDDGEFPRPNAPAANDFFRGSAAPPLIQEVCRASRNARAGIGVGGSPFIGRPQPALRHRCGCHRDGRQAQLEVARLVTARSMRLRQWVRALINAQDVPHT